MNPFCVNKTPVYFKHFKQRNKDESTNVFYELIRTEATFVYKKDRRERNIIYKILLRFEMIGDYNETLKYWLLTLKK